MLVPIVEGQSEVQSVGVLIRRILNEDLGVFDVDVARPFRVKRNRVVRPEELERALRQAARSRADTSALLVLLDADDDCPAELGTELLDRASEATHLPVRVVLAKVESEAWILAGADTLRGVNGIRSDAEPPADPEGVRDAKGAISRLMDGDQGYVATGDQAGFFSALDLQVALTRSPSFAKLHRDVSALVAAVSQ